MHHSIIRRLETVHIYDNEDDLNYSSICSVFLYGDTGYLFGLHGVRFYKYMAVYGRKVADDLGVTRFECAVLPAHLRLMQVALRRVGVVSSPRNCMMGAMEMSWVVVERTQTVSALLAQEAADETLEILKRTTT